MSYISIAYYCKCVTNSYLHIAYHDIVWKQQNVSALLIVLSSQIAELQASYDRSVQEQQELTKNIEETQARLKRAAKLTTGLADEQVRWAESVKVRTYTSLYSYLLLTMATH